MLIVGCDMLHVNAMFCQRMMDNSNVLGIKE
jgi:hypothetical protein